ncbi:MAG TPA: FAD-dependent oxidoreductase [Dehalococcoidales bacterium]|nr:FAD-dependent oxidoreductase [Dehalococcoidales bacterium]
MTSWQEYLKKEGHPPVWPYPVNYEKEVEIETDVLVLGGGIAGCWAAISAARKGVRVALVEKSATIRSGAGGPGVDHWNDCCNNPHSKVNADEWAKKLSESNGGYTCGMARQVQCRENYDTLLELEKMGGKIRDVDDEYKGAEGRFDDTKFMFSPRYNYNHEVNGVIRVWGSTFKPALRKEALRLGVKIYDRVMATGLLNEDGVQGKRVIGAMGLNNRTGEFMIFKSKATILCMAGPGSIWVFNTEMAGITTFRSRAMSGDGHVMAFRAGAEMTMMEKSQSLNLGTGFKHNWYGGAGDASYENIHIVDANGKPLPVPYEGWGSNLGQMARVNAPPRNPWEIVRDGVLKGEYALPFYGDFPAMPDVERRITWGLMIGEEAICRIITDSYNKSGFNPARDELQNYQLIEGRSQPQWRSVDGGGGRGGILIDDWNMRTTLEGLYATGDQLPASGDHNLAATTGRYSGRKAADYAKQVGQGAVSREQIAKEKVRVYAPIKKDDGIDWKELHFGTSRAMQFFCSEYKTELLFKMGLDTLNEIEENYVPRLFALDPHQLMCCNESLSALACSQMILQASVARHASSKFLDFRRIDYPELDPPEWNKFMTMKMENGKLITGERPFGYWGDMKKNYEAYNKDYTGVYNGK